MSTSTVSAASPLKRAFDRRVEDVKPSKTDINAIIMDYFVSEGYPRAAQMLAREANIRPAPSAEEIQERLAIKHAIHSGDIQTAIERINELIPQILDEKPNLHFSLLRLQLIELIKSCTSSTTSGPADITPALDFATQNLAPRAPTNPAFLQDLERTMALLIFPPDSLDKNPQLAALLQPGLRMEVAAKVNEAISESLGRRREAKIRDLVRCRAWAESQRRAGSGRGVLPPRLSLGLEKGEGPHEEGLRDEEDGEDGEDEEDGEEEEDGAHGTGETGDLMVA